MARNMDPTAFVTTWIRKQLTGTEAARTDGLRPLISMIAILAASTLGGFYLNAPTWYTAPMFFLLVGAVVVYVATYLVCLRSDPDFLRSERFKLGKMAIEKGFVGDSIAGVFENEEDKDDPKLLEAASGDIEERK